MPKPGTSEYAQWRMTGDIPEPKKADPAPAKEPCAKAKAERSPPPLRNRVISRAQDSRTPIPDSTNCLMISGKRASRLKN